MKIEAIFKIRIQTTEKEFTDQVRREINERLAYAMHSTEGKSYERDHFVHRFNKSNGARFIDAYVLDCEEEGCAPDLVDVTAGQLTAELLRRLSSENDAEKKQALLTAWKSMAYIAEMDSRK